MLDAAQRLAFDPKGPDQCPAGQLLRRRPAIRVLQNVKASRADIAALGQTG